MGAKDAGRSSRRVTGDQTAIAKGSPRRSVVHRSDLRRRSSRSPCSKTSEGALEASTLRRRDHARRRCLRHADAVRDVPAYAEAAAAIVHAALRRDFSRRHRLSDVPCASASPPKQASARAVHRDRDATAALAVADGRALVPA